MTFSNSKIRPYKGKLITLVYNTKGYRHEHTGEITASTKYNILFNINKSGLEIKLSYPQIIDIREPVAPQIYVWKLITFINI